MSWDGNERRKLANTAEAETFNLIMDTRQAVEEHKLEMQAQFHEMKREMESHASKVERLSESTLSVIEKQNVLIRQLKDAFTKAFPEGDAESHRRAHEVWMEKDKAEREMWIKLKQNTINWVVIAVLSWAGFALWAAFLQGPK